MGKWTWTPQPHQKWKPNPSSQLQNKTRTPPPIALCLYFDDGFPFLSRPYPGYLLYVKKLLRLRIKINKYKIKLAHCTGNLFPPISNRAYSVAWPGFFGKRLGAQIEKIILLTALRIHYAPGRIAMNINSWKQLGVRGAPNSIAYTICAWQNCDTYQLMEAAGGAGGAVSPPVWKKYNFDILRLHLSHWEAVCMLIS